MNKTNVYMVQGLEFTNQLFTDATLKELGNLVELDYNQKYDINEYLSHKKKIDDAEILVTSWKCPMIDGEVVGDAKKLKLIIHGAGSVKGTIDKDIWKRGIRVLSCAEPLSMGVAETTLGLTITALKDVYRLNAEIRNGGWNNRQKRIRNLFDLTIGIIGAGHVGRNFMKLLGNFNVEILVFDPVRTEEEIRELGGTKVELEELLENSHVVSIHAPSIPQTHHMINKSNLCLMKDDGILINTARGSIINEEDLIHELEKGRLFACLDVTSPEPPHGDNPLRRMPNVLLTPHIAGLKNNGRLRIGRFIIDEIERYLKGLPLMGEIKAADLNVMA